MTTDKSRPPPDVFISYASEDRDWVRTNIYQPLLGCMFADGRVPRIFFDMSDLDEDSELGVTIGSDLLPDLRRAVRRSPKVIVVLSKHYFSSQKEWTLFELREAVNDDLLRMRHKVIPVQIDRDPVTTAGTDNELPRMSVLYAASAADWSTQFPRVLRAVGLQQGRAGRQLLFSAPVADILVNNTLPPVAVRVRDDGVASSREELVVELTTTTEGFQGTLRRPVVEGVANFSDLSFKTAATGVVLSAKALGCMPATSNPFSVQELPSYAPPAQVAQPAPQTPVVTIPFQGAKDSARLHFFAGGKAFALVDGQAVRVYDSSGRKLSETKVVAPIRLARAAGRLIALVDWAGNLTLLGEDGSPQLTSLAPQGLPYATPGDCVIVGDAAIVGMWNGEVHRIDASGVRNRLFNHEAGIQCLAATEGQVFLCDFRGSFAIYEGPRQVFATPAERSIVGMRLFPTAAVIIGEKQTYQFSFAEGRLIGWPSRYLSRCVEVLPTGSRMLAVGEKGQGVFLDDQLTPREQFHVTAGARPFCSGLASGDSYVSFAYPDSTYALLKNEQVVYTNGGGLLSFDPDMTTVALGTPQGIRLQPGPEYLSGLREGR